jgi:hypothetical protein
MRRVSRLERDLTDLATSLPTHLREKWADVNNGLAPCVPTPLLRRLLAQRLQEKRHGGLPLLVARELERVATSDEPLPEPPRKTVPLTLGTRLIREWNGRTIAVEVTESGFVWEERSFRSLSEIARAVTGAHWSGPRFFGLNRRG